MIRTYRILRSERAPAPVHAKETVVECGIVGFPAADARRNQLQAQEDAEHPGRSSWVKTLFLVELEVFP